jgi:hypothetical protein
MFNIFERIAVPRARRRFHKADSGEYCLTKAIDPDREEGRDVAREPINWLPIGVTNMRRPIELLAPRSRRHRTL